MQKQIDIDYMKIAKHLLERCGMMSFALKMLRNPDDLKFTYSVFALDADKNHYKLYCIKPMEGFENPPPRPCSVMSYVELDPFYDPFYMHHSLGLVFIFPCMHQSQTAFAKDMCKRFTDLVDGGSLEFYDADGYWKTSFMKKGTTIEQLAIECELADSST